MPFGKSFLNLQRQTIQTTIKHWGQQYKYLLKVMDKLFLHFNSREQYNNAVQHFDECSDFFASDYNDEVMQVTFEEESSVDGLEFAIQDELEEYGFTGYWFSAKQDFC